MPSCSQSRHATAALYSAIIFYLKKVGFEPTMGNPTDLQSAALNRSAISPFEFFPSHFFLTTPVKRVEIKITNNFYKKFCF